MKARKEVFFFEKKKQKTFANLSAPSAEAVGWASAHHFRAAGRPQNGRLPALRWLGRNGPGRLRRIIGAAAMLVAMLMAATPKCQAASTTIDPKTRAAAETMFEAIGGNAEFVKIFDATRGVMITNLMQSGHVSAAQAASVCDEILMPAVKRRVSELTAAFVEVYAENFTTSELNQMTAFYETPVGRKNTRIAPILAGEFGAVVTVWSQRVSRDAIEQHRKEILGKGIKL
jgi:hypothetical protein